MPKCAYTSPKDGFRCQKDGGDLSGMICQWCEMWFCGHHEGILDGREMCIHCRIGIDQEDSDKDIAFHCSFRDRHGSQCENKADRSDVEHDPTIECEDFKTIRGYCLYNEAPWGNHYTFYRGWSYCSKCKVPFCKDHADFLMSSGVCFYCHFET